MKEVYTTGEVAKICNVTIRTVIKWFESGKLKGYKIPGSRDRRIPRASLVEFLDEHQIPTASLDADRRRKILIVDDEVGIVDFLKEYFEGLGFFDVRAVHNGYEAGIVTMEFRPEVLVLDFNLGDIDGLGVTKIIRGNPELKGTKIVVMSGYLKDSDVDRILAEGVNDFIRKPFKIEEIREKVYKQLGIT